MWLPSHEKGKSALNITFNGDGSKDQGIDGRIWIWILPTKGKPSKAHDAHESCTNMLHLTGLVHYYN